MRASRFVDSSARSWEEFEVEPNVFGGFRVLRGGPAFGLVGSYEQVAERLDQLIDLGVDAFILASNPHLEEAYRVGEEVLPLLRGGRAGRPGLADPQAAAGDRRSQPIAV